MANRFNVRRIAVNSTTPVKILDGFVAPEGAEVTIRVTGASAVFVGADDVTYLNGINVTSLVMPIKLKSYEVADLYAITQTSTTSEVAVFLHDAEEV
jgi:hypothetical protein